VTFPLSGAAEVAGEITGYWPEDGWVGDALRVPLMATEVIEGFELQGWIPEHARTPMTLRARVGSWEAETELGAGPFSWRFASPMAQDAVAWLTVRASPSWVPTEVGASNEDQRQLAFVLRGVCALSGGAATSDAG
jgi:hypothetical protein